LKFEEGGGVRRQNFCETSGGAEESEPEPAGDADSGEDGAEEEDWGSFCFLHFCARILRFFFRGASFSPSEVQFSDFRVFQKFRGGVVDGDFSEFEGVPAIGDLECGGGVLLDHQDRGADIADLPDFFKNFGNDARCESDRGFVEADDFRRCHQTHPDRDHLPFSAGEDSGFFLTKFFESGEDFENFGFSTIDFVGILEDERTHFEIFIDCEIGKNVASLRNEGDAGADDLVGFQVGDFAGCVENLSGANFGEVENRTENRGFSGAVRSDDGDDFGGAKMEIDAVENVGTGGISGGEVLDFELHFLDF